jgi:pimeloyl-ACP methyl ester carboxylesterase
MLPKLVAAATTDVVRGQVRAMFEGTPAGTAVADLMAMRDRVDSVPALPSIGVPALIIRGDEDAIIPAAEAEGMARAIPGARLVAIPNGGHLAPMENPVAANAAIRSFLEAHSHSMVAGGFEEMS